MSLISEIENDRRIGTPGPWEAIPNDVYWQVNPANRREHDPYQIGDVCSSDPGNPDSGLQEANAKRFARVPDMEAALLTAEELARRASALIDGNIREVEGHAEYMAREGNDAQRDQAFSTLSEWEQVASALTAYRLATGADQ